MTNNLRTATHPYHIVPNDPIAVRHYTLKNGLQLYLSVNPKEPRIFSNIVFRTGSKYDPPETTGLAHYMEHMLFKGTSRIGALDWEREKHYLEQIADLYEQYRQTADPGERSAIYRTIDRISGEAAQLTAPGEYDKLAAAIGAEATNAYTWVEQTVYVNDIPSNELNRWFELESERFSMMALRLFHTELETVYEEFNISQDNDDRKVFNALRASLFPEHPYGTQTTLGSAEHLRNPSMKNIQRFFESYYVPNNMAIILAGDFDPEEAVALAEQHFGHFEPRSVPAFESKPQPGLEAPVRKTVTGQEAEYVSIAWRLGSSQTEDPVIAALIRDILYNDQAGLIDTNLNTPQLVLEASAWAWFYEDFSVLGLSAQPRAGQSLEEAEKLLLAQVELVRRGDFPDWLVEGIIRDHRLSDMELYEHNKNRVHAVAQAFILGVPWSKMVKVIDRMAEFSKEEVAEFARKHLTDGYAVVYKRQGQDQSVIKVEKPPITPVVINREEVSEYGKVFLSREIPRLEPKFADFDRIGSFALDKGLQLDYVRNEDNEIFRFDLIFEMGKLHDPVLPIALGYWDYLGTDRYSAIEIQQELFRLGLSISGDSNDERTYVTLSGLQESFIAGLKLLDHWLANMKPDETVLKFTIDDLLQKRADAKQERQIILRHGMKEFAQYGPQSPFKYRAPEKELREISAEYMTEKLINLRNYDHRIYYYGPAPGEEIAKLVNQYHKTTENRLAPPVAPDFPQLPTDENRIYLVDFPIVQTDALFVSRGAPFFHFEDHVYSAWYNEYFGLGLSSVVFQELRESKALAYNTFARLLSPRKKEHAHYLEAYIGTQPDKLYDAIPGMLGLIENMPVSAERIEQARMAILRSIESNYVMASKLYWEARAAMDLGYDYDIDKDVFGRLQDSAAGDLARFQQGSVSNRKFSICLLGPKNRIDLGFLKEISEVQELSKEDIFGY